MQLDLNTQHAHCTAVPRPFQESNSELISDMSFDELRELGHGLSLGLDLEALLNNDWSH